MSRVRIIGGTHRLLFLLASGTLEKGHFCTAANSSRETGFDRDFFVEKMKVISDNTSQSNYAVESLKLLDCTSDQYFCFPAANSGKFHFLASASELEHGVPVRWWILAVALRTLSVCRLVMCY